MFFQRIGQLHDWNGKTCRWAVDFIFKFIRRLYGRWDLSCSRKCSCSFMYYGMCSVNSGRHRHRTICFNQIAHLRNNNNSDAGNWPRVEMKVNRQIIFRLKYDWVESNSSWEISEVPLLLSLPSFQRRGENFTSKLHHEWIDFGRRDWYDYNQLRVVFSQFNCKIWFNFCISIFRIQRVAFVFTTWTGSVGVAHAICISAFRIRRCDRTMH